MGILKDFDCGKLHVRIFDTRKAMGECAGKEAAACIKQLLADKSSVNVMFAAAPSQNETLAALIADNEIDWSRVNAFHMDEYVGLDPTHPAGFRNYLKRAIFDLKPFGSIHLLNGNAEDPEQEALRYSRLLERYPMDVCLLGIGENGHIAFNDPSVADFNDPRLVKIVELEDICRMQQVNDGCFERIEDVPTHALTVTIPGLMRADQLFCSVPATTKATAVMHMLTDEVSAACPASILRQHEHSAMYVDAEAAERILSL